MWIFRREVFTFDSANTEIIRSLKTVNGQYADVYYMNKKKTRQGAFRYRQTPLDRWMSPTNAPDGRLANEALAKFSNQWEALEYSPQSSLVGLYRNLIL